MLLRRRAGAIFFLLLTPRADAQRLPAPLQLASAQWLQAAPSLHEACSAPGKAPKPLPCLAKAQEPGDEVATLLPLMPNYLGEVGAV